MSDKPETESSEEKSAGMTQKGPPSAPKKALSFDEVMKQAEAPPPPVARPAPQRSAPPPVEKRSAQPSFEEIMAGVRPDAPGSQPGSRPPEVRKSRPPRPQRSGDDRKMPIVVHKPTLGAPLEPSSPPPAQEAATDGAAPSPAEDGSPSSQGKGSSQEPQHESPQHLGDRPPRREAPQKREQQPIAESVYAQPGADEATDFGAMFAEAQKQRAQGGSGKLKPGQRLSAKIAHLGGEVAFLDLGGKGEAIIDLRELRNDKGDLLVQVGETIDGYVLSLGEGNVVLTRSVPKGAGREVLQQALDSKVPVEGTVTAHNKGGLEIDLGGTRAFCPASQVDIRFQDDLGVFVGQKLQFRVMELRGGNAILSRRALLDEERAIKAVELRKHLEVGATLEGVVTGVRDFGAFVDLGGIEGLVHVSELSHVRVAHAQDVVKTGQKVSVQVLRIEKDEKGHDKVALSLRALEQDPWDAARPQLEEGKTLTGKVVRLQPFGAFVELFPGVDGLVHVSALASRHIAHPREVVKEGDSIEVRIESIDDAQRRVSLRRVTGEEEAPAPRERPSRERSGSGPADGKPAVKKPRVGDTVDATVDRCEVYGVFVKWEGGKGLVPNPELGTERGSDNKKVMPIGTQFKALIIDLDEKGRYRLSKTGVERAADRADYDHYRKSQAPAGKGFGTLGDLLRAKLAQAEQTDEE